KNSGGDWADEKVVPLLTIHQGSGRPPVPPLNANKNVVQGFLLWAIANPVEVLQPTFYTILKGDPWTVPGAQAVAANGAPQPLPGAGLQPFDPTQQYTPDQVKLMTPEQKLAWQKAQYQKRQEEQKNRTRSAP